MVEHEDSVIVTVEVREEDTGLEWSWREKEKTKEYRETRNRKITPEPKFREHLVLEGSDKNLNQPREKKNTCFHWQRNLEGF